MSVKTTIKTDLCSFSEYRIFPGRGSRYIAKDGKLYYFISSKCKSLFLQRTKPVRLTWTQAWRRANKKFRSTESQTKRRTRRTARVQKAIVGLTLDEFKKKKDQKPELRQAATAALKEAKDRKKKQQDSKSKLAAPKVSAQVSKVQKGAPSKKSGGRSGLA